MSYVQGFTVALSSNAATLTYTDTSTGTDASIASRRIYMQKFDGTYLVPTGTSTDYVVWALSDGSTKTLTSILSQDEALNITVQWLDVSNTVLYSKTVLYNFSGYAKIFFYQLTQYASSTANPNTILNNSNYFFSKAQLWAEINAADNAVSVGGDITSAQAANQRAKKMINNPQIFY